jgi:hypothetical protein
MTRDLQSSDMSYSQIMSDCAISERFAKYAAKRARNRWLKIEVHKGKQTRNGRQNLYHGIIPPDVVELLRTQKAKGLIVAADTKLAAVADAIMIGVHTMHPEASDGVHGRGAVDARVHQEAERGAHHAPLLSTTHQEEKGSETSHGVHGVHPVTPPHRCSNDQGPKPQSIGRALSPEIAFAERNVFWNPSGKLSIGPEFNAELLETYTESQIERAIERAPQRLGRSRDPAKAIQSIRWAASYAKQDDTNAATFKKPAAFTGRSGNSSL